jgi:ATP-dependent protease Clp ATPase subunit
MEPPPPEHLECSFCGKPQKAVLQMIAGAKGIICNECVEVCVEVITHKHPEWLAKFKEFVNQLDTSSKRPGAAPSSTTN